MSDLCGTIVADKWRLESPLGRGTFGEVWLARHCITGREKALKLLFEEFTSRADCAQRFVREAQAASRTDSPHVVSIDDIGLDAALGRAWLVMELLRGESLLEYISKSPYRVPAGEALAILRQIAAGLDAAHRAGIIHRDLKPENVVLCWRDDGSVIVKVLDFGIAKLVGARASVLPAVPERAGDETYRTVGFIGTPGYAAPEQILDAGTVTTAADVFALGVCSYEMLTGCTYWRNDEIEPLFCEVALGAQEAPSVRAPVGVVLPAAYDAWFLRACALDPADRFASAGEAVLALGEALGQRDPLPSPRARSNATRIVESDARVRRASSPRLSSGPEISSGNTWLQRATTLEASVPPPASRRQRQPIAAWLALVIGALGALPAFRGPPERSPLARIAGTISAAAKLAESTARACADRATRTEPAQLAVATPSEVHVTSPDTGAPARSRVPARTVTHGSLDGRAARIASTRFARRRGYEPPGL